MGLHRIHMKIAIISDIHDNLVNLGKCLSWCGKNQVEAVVCPGDVTNLETLEFLDKNSPGPIYLVRGNMEIFEDEDLKNFSQINYGGRVAVWEIDGLTIGACHEPFLIAKVLEKGNCDLVFYGHTHKPWEEERQGARVVNPGTLGGVFSKASFALFNTANNDLELKLVDNL